MRQLLRAFCLLSVVNCSTNGGGHSALQRPGPFQSFDITSGLQCGPDSGLLGCLRAHERLDAGSTTPAVTRRGERLCILTRSEPTCFEDGGGIGYVLFGRAADQYVVVETEGSGGYVVILVDASDGSRRRVDNRPLHSSEASLFATVSYDTDAGYVPNRVAVWSAAQPTPLYEVDDFPTGEGPTGIRWIGPCRLEVRYSRELHSPGQDGTDTFVVWKDEQGVWKNDYEDGEQGLAARRSPGNSCARLEPMVELGPCGQYALNDGQVIALLDRPPHSRLSSGHEPASQS